jgi:hypothetical protein
MGNEAVSLPRALWILSRPRLIPFVLLLPLVGFGWGHWDRALDMQGGAGLPWVVLAWLFLQCGTMWLNAALDLDSGQVLMGRAIAVPAATPYCAYTALVFAVGCAFLGSYLSGCGHFLSGYACVGCAVLSVLYSHPSTAWKGHAFLGPLVNVLGYGLLSTLAGWALVNVSPNPRTVIVWLLGACGLLGCYFAVQAFQAEEDRARHYRTLVATHGPGVVLLTARICLGIGYAGGGLLAIIGWLPRLCLLAFLIGWWLDRYFADWARQPNGGDERWASGLARRLLLVALLAITLAYVDYFLDLAADRPVAGLGTVSGHP